MCLIVLQNVLDNISIRSVSQQNMDVANRMIASLPLHPGNYFSQPVHDYLVSRCNDVFEPAPGEMQYFFQTSELSFCLYFKNDKVLFCVLMSPESDSEDWKRFAIFNVPLTVSDLSLKIKTIVYEYTSQQEGKGFGDVA